MQFISASHYRAVFVRKLIEGGLFDAATMRVSVSHSYTWPDIPNNQSWGDNPVELDASPVSGDIDNLKNVLDAIISRANNEIATGEMNSHGVHISSRLNILVNFWAFGRKMMLSSSSLRGRTPSGVIDTMAFMPSNQLRTIKFNVPDTYSINRRIIDWNSNLIDFSSDPVVMEEVRRILPTDMHSSWVNNAASFEAASYWSNQDTLTYRTIHSIIWDLRDEYNTKLARDVAFCRQIREQEENIIALGQLYSNRHYQRQEEIRRAEETRREQERIAREEAARREAQEIQRKIEALAGKFTDFKPRVAETSKISKDKMKEFLNSFNGVLNIVEDDGNGLLPTASIEYTPGVETEFTASENGLFITRMQIPQDKLIKFVEMMKSL